LCVVRPLDPLEPQSWNDNFDFSGDFRLCSPELDDEDCDVISGSGETDATVSQPSTDVDSDSAAASTSGHHRFVYVEQTSSQPEVTSDVVIVVEMTERLPSRHAGRTLSATVPSTAGRLPPYRLVTTTPASPGVDAVGDGSGSEVAERVAINVGLIVGIVGAVSTLVVMLAALLLCRPRPHVAQLSSGADVDAVKRAATSNGDRSVLGARHNIVVNATSQGFGHRFQSAAARTSTADEWFV